ncbi:MAG: N-acetylmuramoyl-L-alanine amidase [Lachnospiraceae bacterium]|nr:N-acetylmuramoyl-L-alanine amidase [Lachnospiraceae bacterium]
MVCQHGTLNVRSGPSSDTEKIASLYRGEQVLILAVEGDWVKIMSATADGYVNRNFLVGTYAETGMTGAPPKDPDEDSNVVNASVAATTAAASVAATTAAPQTSGNGHIVCIDAGHQQAGISEQEPNGPGSTVMKAKLTTGTQGCVTGIPEHQLNLTIALALKQELLNRGYKVVMIRETPDCPQSNAERAQVANSSGAEIFVRIHANSSTNSSVAGAQFYAPSPANPYMNANVINASNTLSAVMLDRFCAATGAQNRGVLQDDGMTGINWCTIPVTIAEMGFMSNPAEDQLMADPSYQAKMVQGLANGIDAYFGR